jgi:hypothetical protein
MTIEHNEFPPLSPTAKRFLLNVLDKINVSKIESNTCWYRQIIAAAIHEAVNQPVTLLELLAIADNLHALPPEPPTREQMEIALGRLLRHTNDPAGCHEGSLIAELANILRRGVAHHCSPTP